MATVGWTVPTSTGGQFSPGDTGTTIAHYVS